MSNTSLAMNAFDDYCELSNKVPVIYADCLAEVDCPCCTGCYDDMTGDFNLNQPQVCSSLALDYAEDEDRGLSCECSVNGLSLSCDESCETCNKEGTICASSSYEQAFDDAGEWLGINTTYKYTRGLNDTVVLGVSPIVDVDAASVQCWASVNGNMCRSCTYRQCPSDGFLSIQVNCINLEGVGESGACASSDVSGPLSVVTLQDPFLREGCAPKFLRQVPTAPYLSFYL